MINTEKTKIELSEGGKRLLARILDTAPNWSGTPPCYEVICTAADKGWLTELKKKGYVSTYRSDGFDWISPIPAT